MKNSIKKLTVICLMILTVAICLSGNVQAAVNSETVSYTLQDGTLTVKGKGKMPETMTFEGNENIKKVVITEGVTSISDNAFQMCTNLTKVTIGDNVKTIGNNAFYNCEKLSTVKIGKNVKTIKDFAFYQTAVKSVTVPKKVNSIGLGVFYNCKKLKTLNLPGNIKYVGTSDYDTAFEFTAMAKHNFFSDTVDTINFSTDVSEKFLKYCFAKNLNVSKKDKHYKSIKGVIYSKDGKKLVRVPERTKLTVVDGCEEFLVDSVLYSAYIIDDVYLSHCSKLKTIVLPKSVKKVSSVSPDFDNEDNNSLALKKFEIRNKALDMKSILKLLHAFRWDDYENEKTKNNTMADAILRNFPDRIQLENNMYITTDGLLLYYKGKDAKIVIPSKVKAIDDGAIPGWLGYSNDSPVREIVINNKNLPMDDIVYLIHTFSKYVYTKKEKNRMHATVYSIVANFPNRIKVKNNMYITTDGLFLRYTGTDKEVVVPEGVKKIDLYAFIEDINGKVKKVKIPSSAKNADFLPMSITKIVTY